MAMISDATRGDRLSPFIHVTAQNPFEKIVTAIAVGVISSLIAAQFSTMLAVCIGLGTLGYVIFQLFPHEDSSHSSGTPSPTSSDDDTSCAARKVHRSPPPVLSSFAPLNVVLPPTFSTTSSHEPPYSFRRHHGRTASTDLSSGRGALSQTFITAAIRRSPDAPRPSHTTEPLAGPPGAPTVRAVEPLAGPPDALRPVLSTLRADSLSGPPGAPQPARRADFLSGLPSAQAVLLPQHVSTTSPLSYTLRSSTMAVPPRIPSMMTPPAAPFRGVPHSPGSSSSLSGPPGASALQGGVHPILRGPPGTK